MTEFHLFPLLPTELRLKIWKLFPTGRVVEPPRVTDEPCALLSTCQESRELYFQLNVHQIYVPQYKDYYARDLLNPRVEITNPSVPILFHPEIDLLVFDHGRGSLSLSECLKEDGMTGMISKETTDSIRHVGTNCLKSGQDFLRLTQRFMIGRLLEVFPALEQFVIVVADVFPVLSGPLQVPVDREIAGTHVWETKEIVQHKVQDDFEQYKNEHPEAKIPHVRVIVRTFEGFYDVENDCFPWGKE